jgi:serine O-acetyltransferase
MSGRRFRRLTEEEREEIRRMMEKLRGLHPPLFLALAEDARSFSARRGERFEFDSRRSKWLNVLRLMCSSDHFAGLVLYRIRTSLRLRGIPLLPRIIYLIDTYVFRITIGEHVVLREGAYIPHGDVLIDGLVYLGRRCVILPFSTIGLVEGEARGPWIEDDVEIGTGARVLGPVQIGRGARIGANAVVLQDGRRIVQKNSTAAGPEEGEPS